MSEVLRLFEAHALVEPPANAKTAVTVSQLLDELNTVDPDVAASDGRVAASDPQVEARRSVGLAVSTLGARTMIMPIKNGPAFESGMRDPAYLNAVGWVNTAGFEVDRIRELVGSAGRRVSLMVEDSGGSREMAVATTEDPVLWPSVERLRTAPALLLRVHAFRASETARALARVLRNPPEEVEQIVLDLRLNPGGSLYEALDAASLFLDEGLPLAATRDNSGTVRHFRAIGTLPRRVDRPLALLVSDHTASAAEAFVRALQVHRRATVIGQPTYGKCVSQRRFPLETGGLVMISNMHILGPGGTPCDTAGITPDRWVDDRTLLDTARLIGQALRRAAAVDTSGEGQRLPGIQTKQ